MQGLSQWVGRSLTCVDMSRITRSGIGGVDVSDIIKSDKRAPVVRNLPRCPTCGSTNIEKISTSSKVGSAVLFGVLSLGKLSKTFKCKHCGYKW